MLIGCAMKPSDMGLDVYRHHYLSNEGKWERGGYSLAVPEGIDPEYERYEPTDDVADSVGGLAIYLFDSDTQRLGFVAGLYASGDEVKDCAAGTTNLGFPGLIREFRSTETFATCTRTKDHSHIVVFDYRNGQSQNHKRAVLNQTEPIFHRDSKKYGGHITASPQFMLSLTDLRAEKGEASIGLWPAADQTGEGQIVVSASLETMPGGARTVPQIKVHHHAERRRLFRLFKHSDLEYILLPESNVKFKPHLMQSGAMGFIVSDEL